LGLTINSFHRLNHYKVQKKGNQKWFRGKNQRQSIDQLGGGFKKEQITPTWVFPKIGVPQNG